MVINDYHYYYGRGRHDGNPDVWDRNDGDLDVRPRNDLNCPNASRRRGRDYELKQKRVV